MNVEFELLNKRKYTTECPRCSLDRQKKKTKSLTVYRDPPNENGVRYIRWECSHAGQCEWNVRQFMVDTGETSIQYDAEINESYSPQFVDTPPTHLGDHRIWWYRNDDGGIIFGSMRKDKADGSKSFHPVRLMDDGTVRPLETWPSVKLFFGQEQLADPNGKVLIVEGEKAAEAAKKLFPRAICLAWRGGASNISTADWSLLQNRIVYLWPDNDDAGKKAMINVAKELIDSTVYMVDTTRFPPKADLANDLSWTAVNEALRDAKLIHSPNDYHSTLDSIKASASRHSNRFLTGWDIVDEKVRFPMSGMTVVEGRTGSGKTACAVNLAYNVLKQGKKVYYFSFEVPEDEIVARLIRITNTGMDIEEIISGLADGTLEEGAEILDYIRNHQLIIIDPKHRLDAERLKTILNTQYNDSLVIIDYIQKVPTKKAEIRYGLVDLTDKLELLAKEHSFFILLLCQLTPHYPDPLLDAPAESKSIHYNADMVLRIWKKHPHWHHPVYDDVKGNYVIEVKKNRNGESDQLLGFNFIVGAALIPTEVNTEATAIQKPEARSTLALERIADNLILLKGGDEL